ncbi:MAG: DUF4251 domain-containing protein [Sphingobacteriales bacterium]|nr:MAG: DUF4251 domain-containing protein [Sphingobacteriales bacterium]
MKTLKSILMIAVLFTCIQASAQNDKATTTKLVNEQKFVFNATTASPMANADLNAILSRMPGGQAGGLIHLGGSRYQLTVDKDSLSAYLPYFGRAYTSNMNSSDSGIKFNSTDFTYETKQKKKFSCLCRRRAWRMIPLIFFV